jgi:hypothetical protein
MRSRFRQLVFHYYLTLRYGISFKQYFWFAVVFSILVSIVPGYFEKVRVVYPEKKILIEGGNIGAADGDTLTVRYPYSRNTPKTENGSVDIYVRSDSQWVLQTSLFPSDYKQFPYKDMLNFGLESSVNGNTIAVMSRRYDQEHIGADIYIFTRRGTIWTEQAKLITPITQSKLEPSDIDLDENTVVIIKTSSIQRTSSIEIFERDPQTADWSHRQTLNLPYYSYTLAIKGSTLVTSALEIFKRDPQTRLWQSQGRLSAPRCRSVAMDKDTIVAGCPGDAWGGSSAPFGSTGAAYIFEHDPKTDQWKQSARLQPKGADIGFRSIFGANYAFGAAVAIRDNDLLVSAHNIGQYNESLETSVYYYHHDPKTKNWSQKAKILSEPVDSLPAGWDASAKRVALTQETIVIGERDVPLPNPRYSSAAFYSFDLEELQFK